MADPILVPIIATIASVLASLVSKAFAARSQAEGEELEARVTEESLQRIATYLGDLPSHERERIIEELGGAKTGPSTNSAKEATTQLAAREFDLAVEHRVLAFKERLERIEGRLPAEASLDKIASVNDAILATRLDAVEEAVRSLADKALSKWDVATIVFATIGGLAGSVGLIAGVVKIVAS